MENTLKNKALQEILNSHDLVIASKNKDTIEKVGKKLGEVLQGMGIKSDEAEELFFIANEKRSDDNSDDGIYLMACTEAAQEDENDE